MNHMHPLETVTSVLGLLGLMYGDTSTVKLKTVAKSDHPMIVRYLKNEYLDIRYLEHDILLVDRYPSILMNLFGLPDGDSFAANFSVCLHVFLYFPQRKQHL